MMIRIGLNKQDDSMVEIWSEDGKYLWAVVHRDLFEGRIYQQLNDYTDFFVELRSLANAD